MTQMGPKRKRDGGAGGAVILMLLGLGAGGLVALSPDIGLPLFVLMLPGLIYLLIDRSVGWAVARAVLLFQAAACVVPISEAWYRCAGIDGCMAQLAIPTTMLRVWLAGGSAWLMAQMLPIGLKLLNDMRLKRYRAVLVSRRDTLISEWGLAKPKSE